MLDFIVQWMPNVVLRWDGLVQAFWETIILLVVCGFLSFIVGLFLGVVLIVTKKGGILQNLFIWRILDFCINIIRAIPFLILIIALLPVTRTIMGIAIGVRGAIFPLVVGTVPFFARQIEAALSEIDSGLIEAAQSMGDSPIQIIFRVYLHESIPSIIRATTITLIALIGYIAIVGSIGGGGIGNFAIAYGHIRNDTDIMVIVVILSVLLVTAIQSIGDFLVRKTTH